MNEAYAYLEQSRRRFLRIVALVFLIVVGLMTLVGEVLRTLTPYEAPVRRAESDAWWIMRIRPYRTLANMVDGVVVTFSDITDLKRAEAEREQLFAAVQQARAYAERIVETVRQPLLVLDADQRVQLANRAFYETFQVTPAER